MFGILQISPRLIFASSCLKRIFGKIQILNYFENSKLLKMCLLLFLENVSQEYWEVFAPVGILGGGGSRRWQWITRSACRARGFSHLQDSANRGQNWMFFLAIDCRLSSILTRNNFAIMPLFNTSLGSPIWNRHVCRLSNHKPVTKSMGPVSQEIPVGQSGTRAGVGYAYHGSEKTKWQCEHSYQFVFQHSHRVRRMV